MSRTKLTRRLSLPLLIAGAIALVQACTTKKVTEALIGTVDVTPSTSTIPEGGTVQLAATVRDDQGTAIGQAVVSWSSSAPSVATVDANGLVRGMGVGTATVRATFQGTAGTATITVEPGPSIVVSADSASLFGATGASPAPSVFQITNGGAGTLTGLSATVEYVSGTGGWLPVTIGASSAPTTMTLSALTTGLPVGVYRAVVSISAAVAGNSPLRFPVKLTVTENEPIIRLTPASLTINAVAGTAPEGAALVQVTNGGGGALTGLSPTVWYLGSTAGWLSASIAGSTAPTQLSVTADASALPPGTYRGEVRIGSPVAVNDQEALPVTMIVTAAPKSADLAVSLTAPGTATAGDRIAYALTVQNLGPDAAEGIEVTTTLPGGVAFFSTTAGTHSAGVISWDLGSLGSGASATATVQVDINAGFSGSLIATAAATGTTSDPVAENNTATAVTTVGALQLADLTVTKTATASVAAGGQVSYQVTVLNGGPDAATGVVVVDTLPAGLTFVSSTAGSHAGGVVTWNVGNLGNGASQNMSIVAGAGVDVADTVVNRAHVASTTPDPAVANNTASAKSFVANFTVSKGSVSVSETGTSEQFTVVLGGQPASDVVLTVVSGDAGEAVVDKATLTFTSGTWSAPQTVTVTGVDDDIIDGPQVTAITIAVDDGASNDAFDALPDKSVSVTTSDDDAPGFTVTESDGATSVSENGTTDDFTVVLDAEPATDVVLTVVSGDTGEATVDKATLTFTNGTWDSPQTVTVTGVNDDEPDGPVNTLITISVDDAASDDDYDPLPDQTVSVTTTDNDAAGILVTTSGGSTLVKEGGAKDTFFVALAAAPPTSSVALLLTDVSAGQITLSETGLTFSKGNWNNPQKVIVTAVDDATPEGLHFATARVSVDAANSDDTYDPVSPEDVSITIQDNDVPPTITLSASNASFSAAVGTGATTQQTIGVTNSGGGTLDQLTAPISYNSGAGWLTATLDATTAPTTLRLTANTGALSAGTYTATVNVTSANGFVTNSPQAVSVSFTVTEPTIQLGATTAGFSATTGGANPAEQTIAISNSGTGTLDQLTAPITYNSGAGWLSATLDATTAPTTLRLNATTGALAAGVYTADVDVTSGAAGVSNSPQTVTVTFTVTDPPPTIQLGGTNLGFSAAVGTGATGEQTIAISNSGGGTLDQLTAPITYNSGAGWLSATLDATTAPTTLRLTANTGALAAGVYAADVKVTSGAAGVTNSPQNVAVIFTVTQPTIQLGATTADFAALVGGGNPAEKTVSISNAGTGTLDQLTAPITYNSGSGWLSATLDATTAPTTLRLNATTGALAAGVYTADVDVTSGAAGVSNSPQTVTVTFTVSNPPPTIQLGGTNLGFAAAVGTGATGEQTIAISNSGGGTLDQLTAPITYNSGSGWLSATLDATAAPTTLRVTANAGALAAGAYTATVNVTSAAAGVTNSPQAVSVTFIVTAPTIQLGATSASFNATEGGANPGEQTISISNSGTGTLDQLSAPITYGTGSGWLSATLDATTAPTTLRLNATTGALTPGVYTADVDVTSLAAGITNSPQTVSVTFTVAEPPPTIQLGGTSASFSAAVGAGATGEQTIAISNSGGGTLDQLTAPITYNSGSGWLNATLDATTAPTTLRLTANTGALAAGVYTADVDVTSGAAGVTNSPQTVTVTFTVTQPTIQLASSTAGFAAFTGGANPTQQTIAVTNSGTGTLDQLSAPITYNSGSGWLSATLDATTAPTTLRLDATTGVLTAGVYTADVDVTSGATGVSNSPQTVTVTFTVTDPPPTIALSATTADFSAEVGAGATPEQTINVTNSGAGTLNQLTAPITYNSGSGWLTATLDGVAAPTILRLTANTGALAAGIYTADVDVTSTKGDVTNSPQTVTVTFEVTEPPPTIQLGSASATFDATEGGGNPVEQTIAISNSGGGTLDQLTVPITYNSGSGWLNATLDATTAPTTLRLNATTGALTAGSYTADVDVTSGAAGVTNSPQTVNVTFTITAELELVLQSVVLPAVDGEPEASKTGG